jgi:hypothetical protein
MSATQEYHHDKIEEGQRKAIADTRDYPILFDTEMVRAILAGTKTETRRLFKSPLSKAMDPAHEIFHDGGQWIARLKNGQCYRNPIVCPYGEPGDYLWVKETTIFNKNSKTYWPVSLGYLKTSDCEKTIPSIHLPKKEARLWLQITDVKAQRIQTITEDEARQEGTKPGEIFGMGETGKKTFREGFIAKWISIYGIESFYENPWVWAVKFTVTDSKPSVIL